MTLDEQRLAELRSQYDACFGCGAGNPIGLHLDGQRRIGDTVVADLVPRPEFSGFEGILHGGVVATALDEVSAWSAMLGHGVFVYTATLEIRYRAPAPTDRSFTLTGRVDRRSGRRLEISASMAHGETVVAESEGLFIVARSIDDPVIPQR